MKKGLNIKANVNTIVELTKKNKALGNKVKLLEKENKKLKGIIHNYHKDMYEGLG